MFIELILWRKTIKEETEMIQELEKRDLETIFGGENSEDGVSYTYYTVDENGNVRYESYKNV